MLSILNSIKWRQTQNIRVQCLYIIRVNEAP